MSRDRFDRIKAFSDGLPTPSLILDLDEVRDNYGQLSSLFPKTSIYYAVKANPHPEVLKLLSALGASFDVASIYELDLLLSLGVSPERMSYGNTIKKERDIAYFYEKGVRLYASDSIPDVEKISRAAPGSKVYFRILTEGLGADWPLSKKFGSHPDLTRHHIMRARDSGLEPWGISFHVGSQQRDIGQWSTAITTAAGVFAWAEEKGVHLRMLNMGGGFPATTPSRRIPWRNTPRTSSASSTPTSATTCPRSSSSRAAPWSGTAASSSPRS
jgi:ornithine decarboxylase